MARGGGTAAREAPQDELDGMIAQLDTMLDAAGYFFPTDRGAFNNLPSPTLASHAIKAAVERAGIDGAEVDDVIIGSALQQGHQAGNIARTSSSNHT